MKSINSSLFLWICTFAVASMMNSCKTEDVVLPPAELAKPRLVINEVLYDPSNSALAGDANGDGVYGQNQDEFIELYNDGGSAYDLSGVTINKFIIADSSKTIGYTFPKGYLLDAGKAVVVFGGGTPTGTFGGSKVEVAQNANGLNLGNSGEMVYVCDSLAKPLLIFNSDALSNNPNESYTRTPDINGLFGQHSVASPGKLFSPGTKLDFTSF